MSLTTQDPVHTNGPAAEPQQDSRYTDIGKQKYHDAPVVPMYVIDNSPEQQPIRQKSARTRPDYQQSSVPVPTEPLPYDPAEQDPERTTRTRNSTSQRNRASRNKDAAVLTAERVIGAPVVNGQSVADYTEPTVDPQRISSSRDSRPRRSSVTERSPLQRLEEKIGDISKEEKRARLREAESATERRISNGQTVNNRAVSADPSYGGHEPPTPVDVSDLARTQSERRRSRRSEPEPLAGVPVGSESRRAARDPQVRLSEQPRYQTNRVKSIPASGAELSRGIAPQHPDSEQTTMPGRGNRREPHPLAPTDDAEFAAGQLPAHYGAPEREPQDVNVARSNSRKLQKRRPNDPVQLYDGPAEPRPVESQSRKGKQQLQTDRMGMNLSYPASGPEPEPDIVPRESVQQDTERGPNYRSNPQTRGAHQAKQAVELGDREDDYSPEPEEMQAGKPKRGLSNLFGLRKTSNNQVPKEGDDGIRVDRSIDQEVHRQHHGGFFHHRDAPRPRIAEPFPEDWKRAQPISLTEDDLNLDAVKPSPSRPAATATGSSKEEDQAWWEKPEGERRSSGSQRPTQTAAAPTAVPQYDGNVDARSGQTYYSPQLYMKCGPLLRFTGIETRRRSSSSRPSARPDQEIWRGSIMIVTIDSKSSYRQAPVLRLFKQQFNLLPPPPAEIGGQSTQQNLRPEYVDPIAGQVKMSRVGKTLYVKPVEELEENKDLSRIEDDRGLFTERQSKTNGHSFHAPGGKDGEKLGKVREIGGTRLYSERGVTFWKFKIEIELGKEQARIAYRINRGPAVGFWVPARGQMMNMMFHSCNGFSLSVKTDEFSGPDPMWRDVLNTHQFRPFHVMIGGGDQLYMDAVTTQTQLFREWAEMKNPHHKRTHEFSPGMQNELENFYLNRYSMWFSQGLFGLANSQIPMVNIWDDHDIIDGFGSYPHHTMASPVFAGLGAVAFKYYMLFQHQSAPQETEREEPSWLLGASPGPYIEQLSRSLFMNMGRQCAFLGIDCRTERMRDSILCQESWDRIFDRCRREIQKGTTKHLIVLLGVPIAYPRLNFLENVLTSRAMDPLKALGRAGMLGGFVNKFDGGVEILDDLDDHWTAKHHKQERNYFIQELQEMAAEKSVRVTILGGDVHLAAIGQFYSNKKLGIPKDRDHRYMPNIVSSAIVNTPPGDMLADVLNKRNKVHHLDAETDEDMIAIFFKDVDGKKRNNVHLLPKRNWCSLREYQPGTSPPPTPPSPDMSRVEEGYGDEEQGKQRPGGLMRSLSGKGRPGGIMRRFSSDNKKQKVPPIAYYNAMGQPQPQRRHSSDSYGERGSGDRRYSFDADESGQAGRSSSRPGFHRKPTFGSIHDQDERGGRIDLTNGLDIRLNVETVQGDPAGITTEYRLIVPALDYRGAPDTSTYLNKEKKAGGLKSMFGSLRGKKKDRGVTPPDSDRSSIRSNSGSERSFEGQQQSQPQPQQANGGYQEQKRHSSAPAAAAARGVALGAVTLPTETSKRGRHVSEQDPYRDQRDPQSKPAVAGSRDPREDRQSMDVRRSSGPPAMDGYVQPAQPQDLLPPGTARTAQMPTHLSAQFKPQATGPSAPMTTAALVQRQMSAKQQQQQSPLRMNGTGSQRSANGSSARAAPGPAVGNPGYNTASSPENPNNSLNPRYREPDYEYHSTDHRSREDRHQHHRQSNGHSHRDSNSHANNHRDSNSHHRDDRHREHQDHRGSSNGNSNGRPVHHPQEDIYSDEDQYTDYDGQYDDGMYESPGGKKKGWKFWQK